MTKREARDADRQREESKSGRRRETVEVGLRTTTDRGCRSTRASRAGQSSDEDSRATRTAERRQPTRTLSRGNGDGDCAETVEQRRLPRIADDAEASASTDQQAPIIAPLRSARSFVDDGVWPGLAASLPCSFFVLSLRFASLSRTKLVPAAAA